MGLEEPSHRRPFLSSAALMACMLAAATQPCAANLLPQNLQFQSALAAHTYTPPRSAQWLQQQAPPVYPTAAAPAYPPQAPPTAAYQAPAAPPVAGQFAAPATGLPPPMAQPDGPPLVTDEVATGPCPHGPECLDTSCGKSFLIVSIPLSPPALKQSVEEAKRLYPGKPVNVLTHRSTIRMAALNRQLNVYSQTPSWVYITTFLAMVGSVIVGFFYVEKVWRQRQDEDQMN